MPHQDQGRVASAIGPALDWLVDSEAFGSYTLRRDSRFTPASLVKLVLLWAWGEQATLTDRFAHAREVIASHADDQRQSVTYQAFVKLLRRHSNSLLYAVVRALQARLRESFPDAYRVAGFVVFGVDGTRVATPRTAANQAALDPPPKRRSKKPRLRSRRCLAPNQPAKPSAAKPKATPIVRSGVGSVEAANATATSSSIARSTSTLRADSVATTASTVAPLARCAVTRSPSSMTSTLSDRGAITSP